MFSDDEKLRYFDRLTVAKDIVCNIKDEMSQVCLKLRLLVLNAAIQPLK